MKNYYVLSNGRVRREANTIYIENKDGQKKPIPIEDVDSLYLYGEVELNTRLLNFLSQKRVVLHVFNYYGFYAGSFYPREYLHSGFLLVHQVAHYNDTARRLLLARELVRASAHSLLRNVAYYDRRRGGGAGDKEPAGEIGTDDPPASGAPTDADTEEAVDASLAAPSPGGDAVSDAAEPDPLAPDVAFAETPAPLAWLRTTIEGLAALVDGQTEVNALRGIEGKARERYYQAWPHILSEGWAFERRVRRPPDNEVNALISFGNSVLYTVCLSEIYRTQLTPTISYLHEPGAPLFAGPGPVGDLQAVDRGPRDLPPDQHRPAAPGALRPVHGRLLPGRRGQAALPGRSGGASRLDDPPPAPGPPRLVPPPDPAGMLQADPPPDRGGDLPRLPRLVVRAGD
jgi:CRISPR/Cas system-associated endonuclease Cas1